jgi:hypothetical protein
MRLNIVSRSALIAVLFTAIPLSSATGVASKSESPSATQAARLTNLKTRGTAEIERRLASLTAARTTLNAGTRLTQADKNTLVAEVAGEITALTALSTKLGADTDLAVARTDVQSIVTDYRVYALILPKARLAAAADRFVLVEDQLTQLQAKLQAKTDAAKTAGKDTTVMEASISDMAAKIANSKTITDGFVAQLLALHPTDYNASHALLASYRESLVAARTDLKTARDDAKSIVAVLKAVK